MLVQRVLRKDRGALEHFVRRMQFVARILAARNQRLGQPLDTEDLEDLVQDTLALLWTKLDQFAGQAALETWIYPFCIHGISNAVRKKRRRQPVVVNEDFHEHEPEDMATANPWDHDEIHLALQRLGPPQEDVIRLKFFDGLTFEEIGQRLSVPMDTAKTWFYRGLRQLRSSLASPAGKDRP
jgi:RNA polymerase sigma-70 factor (ECF subfamily)